MRKTLFILSIAIAGCGAGSPTPVSLGRAEPLTNSLIPASERLPSCSAAPAPRSAGSLSLDTRADSGLVTVRIDGVPVCLDTIQGVDDFILGWSGILTRIAPGSSDPMPATGDDPTPSGGDGTGKGSSDPMPAHGK